MSTFVPLSKNSHKSFKFKNLTNFSSLKGQNICPVCIAELRQINANWPLAFLKKPDETLGLFVLQGFEPGQNLAIDEKGFWLSPYVPSVNRTLPFKFSPNKEGEDLILVYDQDLDCVREENKADDTFHPIFEKNDVFSENFTQLLNFMKNITDNLKLTGDLINQLNDAGLIIEWPIDLKFKQGKKVLKGLYKINEEKLYKLSSKLLTNLMKTKALELAFGQIFSIGNLERLAATHIRVSGDEKLIPEKMSLREEALAKQKKEENKELNELVKNLMSDE